MTEFDFDILKNVRSPTTPSEMEVVASTLEFSGLDVAAADELFTNFFKDQVRLAIYIFSWMYREW